MGDTVHQQVIDNVVNEWCKVTDTQPTEDILNIQSEHYCIC